MTKPCYVQLEGANTGIASRRGLRAMDASVVVEDIKLRLHAACVRRENADTRLVDVAYVDLCEVFRDRCVRVVVWNTRRCSESIRPLG